MSKYKCKYIGLVSPFKSDFTPMGGIFTGLEKLLHRPSVMKFCVIRNSLSPLYFYLEALRDLESFNNEMRLFAIN